MKKTYPYLDIHLRERRLVAHGESSTANHTGDTDDPEIHRVYLTKGQYNKLIAKIANPQR